MKSIANIMIIIALALFLVSCGPSKEELRQQEIRDSIKLEADREELLEKANRMFDRDESVVESKDEEED